MLWIHVPGPPNMPTAPQDAFDTKVECEAPKQGSFNRLTEEGKRMKV